MIIPFRGSVTPQGGPTEVVLPFLIKSRCVRKSQACQFQPLKLNLGFILRAMTMNACMTQHSCMIQAYNGIVITIKLWVPNNLLQ